MWKLNTAFADRLDRCRVDPTAMATLVGERAKALNEWTIAISVGDDYDTAWASHRMLECCVAVANPLGLGVVWLGRISYLDRRSMITAADACLAGAGDIWDSRLGAERQQRAWTAIQTAHADHWNPLETLAAMAE